jgi:hypothetical protein
MGAMSILALACYAAIGGSALFAWLCGGLAERVGAGLNVCAAICVFLAHSVWSGPDLPSILLAVDGLFGLGFLALAVRYASPWLGGALIFQGLQFGLHAFYLVTARPLDPLHAWANDIDTYGVVICITIGAAAARRSRLRGEIGVDPGQSDRHLRRIEERAGEAVPGQGHQVVPR